MIDPFNIEYTVSAIVDLRGTNRFTPGLPIGGRNIGNQHEAY